MCLQKAAQKAGGIAIQIDCIKYLKHLTQVYLRFVITYLSDFT